jgi:hypothetical protein
MRGRLFAVAGLALVLAYAVGRQAMRGEDGTPRGAELGDQMAAPRLPLQTRQTDMSEPVRSGLRALPAVEAHGDPDPLFAADLGETSEVPADLGPLVDADDRLMTWPLESADGPADIGPALEADEDPSLGMYADEGRPPIEVGPAIDADHPDAAEVLADEGVPMEVGPILNADPETEDAEVR